MRRELDGYRATRGRSKTRCCRAFGAKDETVQQLAARIDGPVAVIGDLHGQVEQLVALLDRLHETPDFENRWLVFIGDFVDRGPDPKGGLDLVTELIRRRPNTTAVCGNHDLAMAAALGLVPTPDYSNWGERWLGHYDSQTTFDSYGASFGDFDELRARMPEQHRQFLATLPWCVEHPQLLFVHAGLDPNTPFDIQIRILREKDFTLNRPQWLCAKSLVRVDGPSDCPFTVVSGHVRVPQVEMRRRRILLDTTGGLGGPLSCVLWPEKQVITSDGEHVAPSASPRSRSWWKVW
ncbi:MAG: metallophosphoesterase [Planctomycetes bacterium]|nr:metallophosphoesterase [Planctomycetota bacterium]